MEDLKLKSIQETEFHRQRENLMKQQHEHVERSDLIEIYRKESKDYDDLIRDVQK